MKIPKLLQSSVDPKKWSLMVKGVLVSAIPLLMFFSGLTEQELGPVIEAVEQIVFYISASLAAFWVVWGFVRKVLVRLGLMS